MKFVFYFIVFIFYASFASLHCCQLGDIISNDYEIIEVTNNSKISQPYKLITKTLPMNVFPLLPSSYKWVKEGNEYIIKKHKDAPSVPLEFVVYADDEQSPSHVNYLTLFDKVNVQSFSHTRAKGNTFEGKREHYSFTVAEPLSPSIKSTHSLRSQVRLTPYLDGHCIDHADTIYPERVNYKHSSADPRNHIPEPDNSYWGLHVRNSLVASIRKQGGRYMQLPYYSLNPRCTNLGRSVPEGIYFLSFASSSQDQDIYHIPWNDEIHSSSQREWESLLKEKEVSELSHGYLPYLSHLTALDQQWWNETLQIRIKNSPVIQGQCDIYDIRLAENLKMAADWEIEDISFKLRYLRYSHVTPQVPSDIHYWHDRALKHADLLFEFHKAPFPNSLLEEANMMMRWTDDEQQRDHWKQVIANAEEPFAEKADVLKQNNYYLRSSKQIVPTREDTVSHSQNLYHVITLHEGKGALNQIKNQPPENIENIKSLGKIWLKNANVRTVEEWLKVNEESFRDLDKNQVEIYYHPRTKKGSWNNIEERLREAGFNNISRKFE